MDSEHSPPRKVPVYFPTSLPQSPRVGRNVSPRGFEPLRIKPQVGLHVADLWSERQQKELRQVMRKQQAQMEKERQVRLLHSLAASRKRLAQAYFEAKSVSPPTTLSPRRQLIEPIKKSGRLQRLNYLITDCDLALKSSKPLAGSPLHSPKHSQILSELVSESVLSLKLSGRKHFAPSGKPWQPLITD